MAQVSYGTITITDTNDIESITMEYAQSTSNSTAPTSGWSENIPTWEQGKYIWQRTRIHKSGTASSADEIGDPVCLTGSTGATGTTGRGVSSIVTSYCNYGTGTPAASYSGWGSTVPVYDSSKPNYWVKVVITYTSGSPATDTSIYKDNGITDATATANQAAEDATEALELAQKTSYAWWWLSEAKTVGSNTFAAGSYGTFIKSEDFQSNPTNQPNIFVDANGLHIRKALVDLASFTGTALTFNNPSSGNAQLVIGSSGALQSGDFSITNTTSTFASLGTKIDLTYGEIYTPYFRVSQGSITGGPAAGVYITGNFETTKAKIGGTKQWSIETFTDSQQVKFASIIGPTKSFIQLGASSGWLLDSKKIHSAWYVSGNYLSYPQLDSKYYDFGINLPDSLSDKFLYIRYNSGSNLGTIYANDSGWTYSFYIDANGNITTTGSIDAHSISIDGQSIAGGSLVAGSLASYGGTSNRPVYFPSSGDNQGKPVQITVTDNSSATAVTSTDTNLITARTLYYAGYTKNTGTVTSVRVQATSPVQSSTSTAQSTSLNTTISLADNYGDTKNPYSSKTKNYVLAAPSGAAGAPSFRLLVTSDIPDLSAIYLPLAGGTVTGPVEFGDSVTADDISTGGLVVSGSATFSNNIAANTINGVTVGSTPKFTDTTYTFANGTNGFTVTPLGGSAQTVTVTPSISNNITGTGTRTADYLAKFSGTNTITNGPKITSGGTGFLKEDGTWGTPGGTYSLPTASADTLGGVKVGYTTSGKNYKVDIDNSGNLYVNVPWSNTTSFTITANANDDDVVILTGTNGTNAVTYSASHATSGVTAGSYGDSSAQTPGYGSTFNVPYITVDTYGHITGISTHTVKIPASDNTDTKVTQTNTTGSAEYRVLFSANANDTTETTTARKNTNFKYNPSTGTVTATTFVGALTGTASGNLTSDSNLAWGKITGAPTTLSGYGITDAKIASGVITLGSNTITPLTSSSTLSAAKLSGAIPSAVTATTQAATDNSTKIATTAYVTTAIANLPEPMVFKGTVGTNGTVTWANLVTAAAANEGWTYKVITAHSAETGKPAAKVGDTIISNGTEWTVIPSGDEPSGTVTSIATGDGLTGGPITTSGTISHADTSTQTSSTNSGRTYIQSIGLDDFGHVTSLSTATETVTNTHNTAYLYAGASNGSANAQTSNGNTYLILVDGSTATTRRKISGSGTVSVASDASGNITITGTAHPTTLPNPKTLTIRAYNSTSTTASYSDSTYYGGESNNTTISVASTNAVTNVSSNNDGKLVLTRADGTQSDPITVKITATTSDTAASADKLNISTDVGSTSIPVYFPSSTGLPAVVTSIAYSLLPVGTGSSQVAQGSHTHGNITNGGDITATAPTIASGDQIIINDHSASKITNGPTFDGSTATQFLSKKGTWETPAGTYTLTVATSDALGGIKIGYSSTGKNYAVQLSSDQAYVNVPWTDTQVTLAAVTSGTAYYPVVGSGTGTATRQIDTTGFVYKGTNGTTSAVGSAILTLGNSTASGTANNKQGQLILYGTNTKKATITLAAPTADVALALPTSGGTLALSGSTTSSSTTGISIADHGTTSVGSASGWSAGTASSWVFEEKTIPNVTNAGSASTWTFSGVTTVNSVVGEIDSTDNTQLNIVIGTTTVQSKSGGGNGTAPTLGTVIKVQSKKSGSNSTVPSLTITSTTVVNGKSHSITDNGHTHTNG